MSLSGTRKLFFIFLFSLTTTSLVNAGPAPYSTPESQIHGAGSAELHETLRAWHITRSNFFYCLIGVFIPAHNIMMYYLLPRQGYRFYTLVMNVAVAGSLLHVLSHRDDQIDPAVSRRTLEVLLAESVAGIITAVTPAEWLSERQRYFIWICGVLYALRLEGEEG